MVVLDGYLVNARLVAMRLIRQVYPAREKGRFIYTDQADTASSSQVKSSIDH